MRFRKKVLGKVILTLIVWLGNSFLYAQTVNPKYDKALSDSLGSDDYGMKMYVLVILKSGPVKVAKAQNDSLIAGHIRNIHRLAGLGKLVLAGPLKENDKEYRGIFILNVTTVEEAAALMQTDPTIRAKVQEVDLYQWYGSAALPVYMPTSEKLGKMHY